MKWLRYFVLLLPLVLAFEFANSKNYGQCEFKDGFTQCSKHNQIFIDYETGKTGRCVECVTWQGKGCYPNAAEACFRNGYSFTVGQCSSNHGLTLHGEPEYAGWRVYFNDENPYVDCKNYDPDDPCGNGKDPATCDDEIADDPPDKPDPDTCDPEKDHCYDDDYDPDKPPCKIMVNGKCVYDDPDRKDKICSNGKCKCFDKQANGKLKEVPCNDSSPSSGGDPNDPCGNGKDPATCDDSTADDPPDDKLNPNNVNDDFKYDFENLDTDTSKLGDPKNVPNQNKEVDLGTWGVNDYFNFSGQCPAPSVVSLGMFGSFEVSYEYFCRIASILRTVVIAFAWLSGLLIIARINK